MDDGEAWELRGAALLETGDIEGAKVSFHKAVALNPRSANAHYNLGVALRRGQKLEEAEAAFRAALALDSRHVPACNNLGFVLQATGRHGAAAAAFKTAIQLNPHAAASFSNLAHTELRQGLVPEALANYQRAIELQPANPRLHGNLLLALHYQDEIEPAWLYEQHVAWAGRHATALGAGECRHRNPAQPNRPLKVGYVSADFRDHPVARFLLPLVQHHDRGQFEVTCYSSTASPDAMTTLLQRCSVRWREVGGIDDTALADRIQSDGIDLLVDLSGHTGGNRLLTFARRPAPIQIAWLGYPDTTGLSTIDYRLTDRYADPPGLTQRYFTERLVHLPESAWCYPLTASPEVAPAPVLTTGAPTFGCFNNLAKINPAVIRRWARILAALPEARLILKELPLADPAVCTRYHSLFEQHGVAPTRISLLGRDADYQTHLARFGDIDVALDTFPYHGTTTTCEALWMGVPVVTQAGNQHLSRVGVSLLSNAGLADLVVPNEDEYVHVAVTLASDPHRLRALRAELRERMRRSPLMDAPGFTHAVENTYRTLWREWCSKRSSD